MNKELFFKIAKVKDMKSFYKLYPSEEAFMAKHSKEFQKAMRGAKIEKAQGGYQVNGRDYISNMFTAGQTTAGAFPIKQPQLAPMQADAPKATQQEINTFNSQYGVKDILNPVGSILGSVTKGISTLKAEKKALAEAKQMKKVTDVGVLAAQTRPEDIQRKYLRPEDNINTGGEFFPVYGVGTNVLAKSGGRIPKAQFGETMSNILGGIGQDNMSKLGVGIAGGENAGTSFGSAIGDAAGFIPGLGPIAKMAISPIAKTVGTLLDRKPAKTKKYNQQAMGNFGKMSMANGMNSMFNVNNAYMEDGGFINPQIISEFGGHKLSELLKRDKYMNTLRTGGSISTNEVGDIKVDSGGYLNPISRNPYNSGTGITSEIKGQRHDEFDKSLGHSGVMMSVGDNQVETELGETAVMKGDSAYIGGDLTVNKQLAKFDPILQEFIGSKVKNATKKIAEKDAKLNKFELSNSKKLNDIKPITYSDKLTSDTLAINKKGIDTKYKINKDKTDSLLRYQELLNKTSEELGIDSNSFSKNLSIKRAKNGGKFTSAAGGINIPGITPKYVDDIYQKMANTNEDFRISKGFPLLKGTELANRIYNDYLISKIGKGNAGNVNPQYEDILTPWITNLNKLEQSADPKDAKFYPVSSNMRMSNDNSLSKGSTAQQSSALSNKVNIDISKDKKSKSEFPWMEAINSVVPYLRPSDVESLDPRHLLGEMAAMSEKEEPVQAQLYHPQLSTPYDISMQDQLNEITAQERAAQKMAGYNPAAQAMIAAQAYEPRNKVLGEQMRINQGMKDKVYGENRNTLNQAQLQNLQILDTQYGRQSQAKSNTKAILRAALDSISSKYLQNQYEERDRLIRKKLYNYRDLYGEGPAQNWNPLMEWNMGGSDRGGLSGLSDDFTPEYGIDPDTGQYEVVRLRKKTAAEKKAVTSKSKSNGGLVSAMHNL
jgi:hypothetical protein